MWKGAIVMPGVVQRNPLPQETGVTVVVPEQ